MTPVPDGFGSPPSHSSLLLPPPLLHYKTQIDRQTDRQRERERETKTETERNRGEKRQEARGGVQCNSSNSAEQREQGKTCKC
jgi:hypothetical protein